MMTGNAGTEAIKARSAQPAHCVVALERFSTKERNVKRNYSQNTPCSVQRDKLALMLSSPDHLVSSHMTVKCRGAEGNVNVWHCEV